MKTLGSRHDSGGSPRWATADLHQVRRIESTSSLSSDARLKSEGEETTLLTLYALAGEECGQLVTLHPRILRRIRHYLLSFGHAVIHQHPARGVTVRELPEQEMHRAEEELWIHDRRQQADRSADRLFAAFSGTKLVGVARCSRHPDGLVVDGVYVLEEFRHQGFARLVMKRLIEECGQHETLYLFAKQELMNFYRDMGFVPVLRPDLPHSITLVPQDLAGVRSIAMMRKPAPLTETDQIG